MGLSNEHLLNATIIPTACIILLVTAVITCYCVKKRKKAEQEILRERRKAQRLRQEMIEKTKADLKDKERTYSGKLRKKKSSQLENKGYDAEADKPANSTGTIMTNMTDSGHITRTSSQSSHSTIINVKDDDTTHAESPFHGGLDQTENGITLTRYNGKLPPIKSNLMAAVE